MKRTVFSAAAVFAMAICAHAGPADVVSATYVNEDQVPITADNFTATDKTLNVTLNFAPERGSELTIVNNTGPNIIKGTFKNIGQGQIINLAFAGVTYQFVANYHGGDGNDLVLLWTDPDTAVDQKLDDQLRLGLKKARGQAPFDKPTTLEPDIPGNLPEGVMVDIQGSISQHLLDRISAVGGKVVNGSVTSTTVEAVVPASELEPLATRGDVKFIATARPSITSQLKP
jgi:hypothetical protein